MTADQTRNVPLTAELNVFIRGQLSSGQYQNVSELARASLRLFQRQHEREKRQKSKRTMEVGDAR